MSYLQKNNIEHDIENNIKETNLPNFTLYYVTELDKNYKRHLPNTEEIKYQGHIYDLNECKLDNMLSIFELNELFTEHVDNISWLKCYVNKYEVLSDNTLKSQMYFQEIKPIIELDRENLDTVLEILSANTT